MNFFFFNKKIYKKNIVTQKITQLNGENISYTLKKSHKARYLRISVKSGGALYVTAPKHIVDSTIERFIQEKSLWILSNMTYSKSLPPSPSSHERKKEYLDYKARAFILAQEKLLHFNSHYNLRYNNIVIKNHKTLWGSCSKKGNLNFNYKIALLPEPLANYIVVHELCHLQEFNHSKKFWDLVAITIPNHKELRRELKTVGRL